MKGFQAGESDDEFNAWLDEETKYLEEDSDEKLIDTQFRRTDPNRIVGTTSGVFRYFSP